MLFAISYDDSEVRVCKAPPLFQIKPDFFLVVRLVPKNICMKSEVNRSTFTGSRLRFYFYTKNAIRNALYFAICAYPEKLSSERCENLLILFPV